MNAWITDTMNSLGYLGIGLLMFLENLFPPIPSELIMPFAGYTATLPNSQIQVIPAIAVGVIGTIVGAIPWYYAGLLLGQQRLQLLAERYGKWIGVSSDDIEKSVYWFQKHGAKAWDSDINFYSRRDQQNVNWAIFSLFHHRYCWLDISINLCRLFSRKKL